MMTVLKGWPPFSSSAQAFSRSSHDWTGTWYTSSAFSPGSVARKSAPSDCAQNVDLPIFVCPYTRTVRSARSGLGCVFAVGRMDMVLLLENWFGFRGRQHAQFLVG